MMRTKLYIYSTVILFSFLSACEKGPEEISATPEISIESVTPTTVKQFQDSLVIKITYKDGDGDLGENVDTVRNVFVTDARNNLTFSYRLSELAPRGQKIAIQGKVNIVVKSLSLIDVSSTQEQTTFTVYLLDRAKNKSNTVTTQSITITQ